jgi:hypothetical protein
MIEPVKPGHRITLEDLKCRGLLRAGTHTHTAFKHAVDDAPYLDPQSSRYFAELVSKPL